MDTFRDLNPETIKYTWWNQKITGRKHNVGCRIDYVLVNEAMKKAVKTSVVRDDVTGSDHCPVEADIDFDLI